jgi:tetrahydromethanopterin S-methyltransferase subunit D
MLSLKVALVVVMTGLQIWMGVAWRREGGAADATVQKTRIGLTVQLALGAAVALLGLGVRSV